MKEPTPSILKIFLSVSIAFLFSCSNSKKENTGNGNSKAKFRICTFENSKYNQGLPNPFCTDLNNNSLNPLGKYEWHLKNTGRNVFSSQNPSANEDINVYDVLNTSCLSGKNIPVAIVDSGLEMLHPSLLPNVNNSGKVQSINFLANEINNQCINDPTPDSSVTTDHGTMVAGIVGMRSNLGYGGSGVAPLVLLSGYNLTSSAETQTISNFGDSLGQSDESKNNYIFNMSFGSKSDIPIQFDYVYQLLADGIFLEGVNSLRNGKGAIFVKSAGNSFKDYSSSVSFLNCANANIIGITCIPANMDPVNTLPYVIVVGSSNASGKHASYSSTGSNLWVSAPGGEYGLDKNWIVSKYDSTLPPFSISSTDVLFFPAIITTDLSGSHRGYSLPFFGKLNYDKAIFIKNSFNAGLALDDDGKILNSNYNYVATMNGTSSAAPIVSGVVALLLEANPKLTWRDVKHILASTAKQIDPGLSAKNSAIGGGVLYTFEQGWVKNAADYFFSNTYGFGRVDAGRAVAMAKTYILGSLGKFIETNFFSPSITLPINVPLGLNGTDDQIKINVTNFLTIESVTLSVSGTSNYLADVAIEVYSPSGTKSIVWNAGNSATSSTAKFLNTHISSNAFYGENSHGTWVVKIICTGIRATNAKFSDVKLKISGH
ncbi:S8 family serine peptidase [Pigmentibacter sp. JX0631]|uniref:S8 family serine peptidase n=1 Tax=Pigmentibacter sp. JX0631 TaxID=2976982 RepID=UPI00246981B2|nr:S8 family serine peptidase [Pigmentibacter sp. JX0631]WGL58919.1 S8 family serine peptidase [Pigmentibacter sp. JX0631]